MESTYMLYPVKINMKIIIVAIMKERIYLDFFPIRYHFVPFNI